CGLSGWTAPPTRRNAAIRTHGNVRVLMIYALKTAARDARFPAHRLRAKFRPTHFLEHLANIVKSGPCNRCALEDWIEGSAGGALRARPRWHSALAAICDDACTRSLGRDVGARESASPTLLGSRSRAPQLRNCGPCPIAQG